MEFCQNVNGFSWTVVNPNISAIARNYITLQRYKHGADVSTPPNSMAGIDSQMDCMIV